MNTGVTAQLMTMTLRLSYVCPAGKHAFDIHKNFVKINYLLEKPIVMNYKEKSVIQFYKFGSM